MPCRVEATLLPTAMQTQRCSFRYHITNGPQLRQVQTTGGSKKPPAWTLAVKILQYRRVRARRSSGNMGLAEAIARNYSTLALIVAGSSFGYGLVYAVSYGSSPLTDAKQSIGQQLSSTRAPASGDSCDPEQTALACPVNVSFRRFVQLGCLTPACQPDWCFSGTCPFFVRQTLTRGCFAVRRRWSAAWRSELPRAPGWTMSEESSVSGE